MFGNQEARNHKKYINADEATPESWHEKMVQDDGKYGDSSQPIDIDAIGFGSAGLAIERGRNGCTHKATMAIGSRIAAGLPTVDRTFRGDVGGLARC
jgi:hypothetical protein